MVRLTKIYTKTGDTGTTGLASGARVAKHDPRVAAYGEVDEANAAIGLAVCACPDSGPLREVRSILADIQNDLFDVGADLATPIEKGEAPGAKLRATPEQALRLEGLIDRFNEDLESLRSFVLPGGTEFSARLHAARTVVRRAERSVSFLIAAGGDAVSPHTLVYLNRLSDLLFVLARAANDGGRRDVLWVPGANRAGPKKGGGG